MAEIPEIFKLHHSVLTFQLVNGFLLIRHKLQKQVKNVKVSLARGLADDAALLQKVVSDR